MTWRPGKLVPHPELKVTTMLGSAEDVSGPVEEQLKSCTLWGPSPAYLTVNGTGTLGKLEVPEVRLVWTMTWKVKPPVLPGERLAR